MAKKHHIDPALITSCFVLLGITIGAAVFSPALDTTKLEAEDSLRRASSSGSLRPGIEVK
jgi:hypothetical protein